MLHDANMGGTQMFLFFSSNGSVGKIADEVTRSMPLTAICRDFFGAGVKKLSFANLLSSFFIENFRAASEQKYGCQILLVYNHEP